MIAARLRSVAGRRNGYSLLELIVVALLAAALIALVGRWVGQLGQLALQQAASGIQVESVVAADRLEDDLTAAVRCSGTDSEIREITAGRIEFYVLDEDGNVDVVRWEVDPVAGVLTRAEVPALNGCTYPPVPEGSFVLDQVATGSAEAPLFIPVSDADSGVEDIYGLCTDRDSARCRISSVEVNLTVLDGGVPVVSRQVIRVGT